MGVQEHAPQACLSICTHKHLPVSADAHTKPSLSQQMHAQPCLSQQMHTHNRSRLGSNEACGMQHCVLSA
eukprot:11205619-Lingulodinium_polyedra.AAC.1